ncbi:myosin heavy chain, embryonic smooth muscle isoform isoform X1 [Armigeres subalbatus]|uniref:myosin heavy chain, embryonic smooth muscle isoform isoform X1 n=1 Tax=Armigeres subalbatus TaxID=124917 RepID=UPI002ED14094
MTGDRKNESFKLLQLSDDSKSLSDLELPEIINQRKRKVRRKTRSRTTSVRHDDDRRPAGSHIDCKNFGLWLAILMTIMWLFIISYITSVVHSENRRLEIAIQKVSATSQNVPEALQKWHETSKNLEQNQTALNGKLREIQQVLSNFSTELKQLRDTIEKKKENSQEAQLNSLKSSVAGLGSKIEDALTRIVALEDQRTKDQGEQKTLRQSVDDLQVLLNKVRNNSSPASMDNTLNNATEQTIANIREQLSAQIENMSQNFTGELQALQQKNIWLGRDVSKHEKSISELIDNSANVSSHVKSVENIWVDMKANLTSLEVSAKQMSEQIDALQNATSGFKTSLGTVRDQCDQYGEQNNVINGEIEAIKKRLEEAERRQVAPTASSGSLNSTNADKDTISKLHQLFDSSPTQSTSQTAGSESEPKQPIAPTSRQPATIAVPSSGVSSSSGSSTITTTTTTATAPAASPSANVGGGGMM